MSSRSRLNDNSDLARDDAAENLPVTVERALHPRVDALEVRPVGGEQVPARVGDLDELRTGAPQCRRLRGEFPQTRLLGVRASTCSLKAPSWSCRRAVAPFNSSLLSAAADPTRNMTARSNWANASNRRLPFTSLTGVAGRGAVCDGVGGAVRIGTGCRRAHDRRHRGGRDELRAVLGDEVRRHGKYGYRGKCSAETSGDAELGNPNCPVTKVSCEVGRKQLTHAVR